MIFIGSISILLLTLGENFKELYYLGFTGFAGGLGIIKLSKKFEITKKENIKLREIIILFEALELYIKSGYSIQKALELSRVLVPHLSPIISATLSRWTLGSKGALEYFAKELDSAESDILVSLLIYIEYSGVKDIDDVIKREAKSIERAINDKEERKIARRPLMLMVFRTLPMITALGIILGPLMYRSLSMLMDYTM